MKGWTQTRKVQILLGIKRNWCLKCCGISCNFCYSVLRQKLTTSLLKTNDSKFTSGSFKNSKNILLLLLQAFKTILHVVRRETYKLPSGSSVARLRDSLVQILNFWIIQTSPNPPHFALPSNKHCISCSNTETFISCHAFRTAHCLFVLYRLPWIFLTVLCQNIYISTQCNCTLSVGFNTGSDIHITAKPYKGTLIMCFPFFMN